MKKGRCKKCGSVFGYYTDKGVHQIFCSRICYLTFQKENGLSEDTKKKMKETAIKIGKRPPSRLGAKQTDLTKKKMSIAKIGKEFLKENWRKIGSSNKGRKQSEKHKQKNSEWRVQHPNKIHKNTSIELKMKSLLDGMKVHYLQQHSLEKIAIVDFYLPEHKLVIQCDGCYWHGCSIHYPQYSRLQEKDKEQDSKLTALGYKVIRFWEHEINNMTILKI